MGMYPDEQTVVIDGVPVAFPGLKAGKFTNGNPEDPDDKPSSIPASSMNLLLDNYESMLSAVGLVPNNYDPAQGAHFVENTFLKPMMFRNLFINGDFRLWQRGTLVVMSPGSKYQADRWRHDLSGALAASTYSRQTFPLGQTPVPGEPAYFLRIALTNGGDAINGKAYLMQVIENVRTLAGRKATLSFWAKADAVKSLSIEALQSFGSGGAPSADVSLAVQKVSLSAVWQKFTMSFDVPTIAGKVIGTDGPHTSSLVVRFWMSAGSAFATPTGTLGVQNGNFDFAMAQLEGGPVATGFEQRPVALELALCQRYYETGTTSILACRINTGSGYFNNYWTHAFKATKRIVPTMGVEMTGGSANGWGASVGEVYANGYTIGDSGIGNTAISGNFTADAEF